MHPIIWHKHPWRCEIWIFGRIQFEISGFFMKCSIFQQLPPPPRMSIDYLPPPLRTRGTDWAVRFRGHATEPVLFGHYLITEGQAQGASYPRCGDLNWAL